VQRLSDLQSNWNLYAQKSLTPIIRAHYYFTVWRNYLFLLYRLPIFGVSLLEIGSSTGQISLRLAQKYHLNPTLVDSSISALRQASQLYRSSGIEPVLKLKSVLTLDLSEKFDIVHSHGLLEHFTGKKRQKAFFNHLNHLNLGGWLICWVPTPDILYRVNRFYLEKTGQWIFGFEEPLTLEEFLHLFNDKSLNIRRIRHVPGWLGIVAQRIK
jgi:cyclopropane fatty-acyl-phospholipid synthase-like methyltransferase